MWGWLILLKILRSWLHWDFFLTVCVWKLLVSHMLLEQILDINLILCLESCQLLVINREISIRDEISRLLRRLLVFQEVMLRICSLALLGLLELALVIIHHAIEV